MNVTMFILQHFFMNWKGMQDDLFDVSGPPGSVESKHFP